MIIAVKGLETASEKLYSVLDIKPLNVSYSIMSETELIDLYNRCNKMVTGFNYRVSNGKIVFRTSVGSTSVKTDINDSIRNVATTIDMNTQNIWTAISCIVSNDLGYRVVVNGEALSIDSIYATKDMQSVVINGKDMSEETELHFILSSQDAIEETMQDFGRESLFVAERENRIVLRLNNMSFIQEFSQSKFRLLMSTIGSVLKQLHTEYSVVLDGYVSFYNAYSKDNKVKGNKQLEDFIVNNKLTVYNYVDALKSSKDFDETTKELLIKGMEDFIEYGNHSSISYRMQDYFLYQYKVSEMLLLKLAICNCE